MNGTNGNEPGYPENALVPYPVIVAATNTAPESKCSGLRATTRRIYNDTSLQPQSER